MTTRATLTAAAASLALGLGFAAPTPALSADYVMSASADYSGPFANVMGNAMAGIQATVNWWNKEVGEDLGVHVDVKIYDMRYDASVVARTWPSILSSDQPIIHLGFGSPDLVTLMKRLPADGVPMLLGTAMVGLVWAPDGWHYSVRPTYSHEFAGLLSKLQSEAGRTLKIAAVSTQNQAGFVDQVNGVKKLAETYPDRFEVVDVAWAETAPVSLTASIRSLAAKNPDVLIVGGTTAQVIASATAMEELGVRIPIIASTHNGLYEVAKGFDIAKLNGSYSAFSFAAPGAKDLPIRDVFEANKSDGDWGLITAQSAAQAILALRVLEQAVAKVGPDAVDGAAMRQALLDHVYTEEELLGALPTVDYDTTAPFPVGDIKATAEVVENGAIHPIGDGWLSVPALEKW